MKRIAVFEQQVEELLSQDQQDEAVKLLVKMVEICAKAREFTKAEAFQSKLLAINDMALTAIIACAEVIEQQKVAGFDQAHKLLWKDLYDNLSEEEGVAFYYALKEVTMAEGQPIILQKKVNNRFFLIEQGNLKAFFSRQGKNTEMYPLGPGDMAGEETFFHISITTFSVVCTSPARLRYLDRSATLPWDDDFPGLVNKIYTFAKNVGRVDQGNPDSGAEKRRYKRYSLEGGIAAQLKNKDGKVLAKFGGALLDVSQGGTCFQAKCQTRQVAQSILARQLEITFSPEGYSGTPFIIKGVVVRLKSMMLSDYSFHIQFLNPLEQQFIVSNFGVEI